MSQNTASKGSEISKDQLSSQTTAPLLTPDKEVILKELTLVDIHGDRKAESEGDKKMLAWTLNEIRKTCGKLPTNKLTLLVESIKRVMIEKTVYQSTIENELKKQRDILKKEVDDEQKAKPNTPQKEGLGASVISFFQKNTDFRLFTKNKLENIGNMSAKEQADFIRTIEQDNDLMAKFMQGFQNDIRWKQNLKSENLKSYNMLADIYNTLSKKYKIIISEKDTLETAKKTITLAKEGQENIDKTKKIANSISQDFLSPLDMEIQQIIAGNTGSNYSKLSTAITVYNISQLYTKAGDTAIKIRKSKQYQELLLLAETSKDKEIIKKFEIFREKLAELDALSKEYDSVAETGTLINQERTLNVLTRLKSKIGAMNQGIQKGERLLEFYNKDEGNTNKSIPEFEADIRAKMAIDGPQNVNARGFSQYLQALKANGNLNYDYLKNTGILQQFGLYWKLKNGSTETQTILGKEDPQALQQFKAVIEKHQEITFSKEKIANGKAFEGLDTYLKNLKVPKEEIESITSALGLSKTGGTIELVALTSLLKSKNSNIRDIASQVLSGYNHNKTVAEADVGTLGKGTIRDMLQQLSTAYACSDIEESLHSIANDPKNPEKTFTLDLKITDLYKAPKSRDKVVKVIETYIKNADVPEKDRIILQKIIAFIQASYKSQTMETVVSNKVVQGQLGALAGKINKKQGKDANFNAQLAAVKSDKSVEKFVENVNKATVFNQEAKTEIKEQTVELDEQVFQKILTLLQLDPIEFSREKLMNSAALRDELMNRIGGNMEWLEKQLTEQEKKQLWRLQSDMVSLIKEDLLTRQKFGTMGSYHTDNQKELRTFHPALAAQREALEIKNYDLSNALYQDLSTQKNYMSSGSINVQSIQNLPAGTPFQLDTNTIFTLSTNGSCSIITPYSIQIIPPEKTNIALGYISAARIFPGLDFMGGLHETLQSYWNSPVLAKMKDGVSNREQCNLIKHYASALGIEGYNQLADTPDALVQSIKNSLPIGTSFWELAKNRGLLRKDGTINPLALGKTFEVQYDYNKPERYQNITKEEEMLIHG